MDVDTLLGWMEERDAKSWEEKRAHREKERTRRESEEMARLEKETAVWEKERGRREEESQYFEAILTTNAQIRPASEPLLGPAMPASRLPQSAGSADHITSQALVNQTVKYPRRFI